jgi:hypothetical protein
MSGFAIGFIVRLSGFRCLKMRKINFRHEFDYGEKEKMENKGKMTEIAVRFEIPMIEVVTEGCLSRV